MMPLPPPSRATWSITSPASLYPKRMITWSRRGGRTNLRLLRMPGTRAAPGRSELYQPVRERLCHQMRARACTQRDHGIAHVGLHGLLGDPELRRDLRVGLAERDAPDDLGLAPREDAAHRFGRSPEVRTPARCGQRDEQHEPAAGGDLGIACELHADLAPGG